MLVYPTMVALNLGSLREKANIKLQVTTQLLNFILFPLVAYVLGLLFFSDNSALRLGLLLMSLLPTSGMTISWTVMAKGNVNSAIRMVVIGLLLGAILTPLVITVLLGTEVDVPFMSIFTQISIVIFAPMLLAYVTQKLLVRKYTSEVFHKSIKPKFPLISTLGVVMIIFVAISLKAKVVINNPELVIKIIVPLIIFYFSLLYFKLAFLLFCIIVLVYTYHSLLA